MTLPVPTLDHVVINARDDMDRAADIYRRLGFTLTERGYHSLARRTTWRCSVPTISS